MSEQQKAFEEWVRQEYDISPLNEEWTQMSHAFKAGIAWQKQQVAEKAREILAKRRAANDLNTLNALAIADDETAKWLRQLAGEEK